MKVLIDALSAREGGGVTYIRHLLPALADRRASDEFHVLLSRRYQYDLIRRLPSNVQPAVVDLPATPLLLRWRYVQRKVPNLLQIDHFDLLFTPTEIGAVRPPCPHVAMVRNLNIYAPLSTIPDARARWNILGHRITREPLAYLTLSKADRLVFVSEASRQQVIRQLRLDRSKARVVHHGVSTTFHPSNRSSVEEKLHLPSQLRTRPYLLIVSAMAPHKNYETLLAAFAISAREKDIVQVDLAIAGGIGDQPLYELLKAQVRAKGIEDRVHFLGHVEHDNLPSLYRNALAFILPSRLETFGLPLVEAMASGTPVIASDLPVCREISRDAALYFNPDHPSELVDRIGLLLRDPVLVKSLSEKGIRRAKEFSWDRTASQLVQIFHEVVNR